jgi:hypothetical protein
MDTNCVLCEVSVSSSIHRLEPCLVALVCVRPFIDYLFMDLNCCFFYFGLFQVKLQLVSKCNDRLHCYLLCVLLIYITDMRLNFIVHFL